MKKRKLVRKAISTVALGTTLSAILAAGAAAYFFTQTKSGKVAAKKIKTTAAGLSREISHRFSQAKTMTEKKYGEIVDEVVDEYAAQKKVGRHTVKALKRDLRAHWREVKREVKAHR